MATAQETIITGLQALRVLGAGQSVDTAKAQYCLKQLNAYIRQIGAMQMRPVGADSAYTVPTTWPAVRVLCQSGCRSVTLPEVAPPDGTRVEVVDAANTAATSNIVISGNGWLIGGAATNTISTNGGSVLLTFRADLGEWAVFADLALATELPFPSEFDEAIALNAAMRFTLFGQSLSRGDEDRAEEGERKMRARYRKPPRFVFDSAVSNIGGAYCSTIDDETLA